MQRAPIEWCLLLPASWSSQPCSKEAVQPLSLEYTWLGRKSLSDQLCLCNQLPQLCVECCFYFFMCVFLTVAVFSGHQNSTFYIKSSISPDDQFLVSGSSDCNAYIWKVRHLGETQVCSLRLAAQICSALWFHLLFMFTQGTPSLHSCLVQCGVGSWHVVPRVCCQG